MNREEFNQYWQIHFPESEPVGHLLRVDYQRLWFRIHTLPESKRYPETEAEYQEILQRHNRLLQELFPHARELLLLAISYTQQIETTSVTFAEIPLTDLIWVRTISFHERGQDWMEEYGQIWLAHLVWPSPFITALLRARIEYRSNDWLLLDPTQQRIYHPYDGGADLILENSSIVQQLKQKYTDWLSKHPQWL